jgi:hypothetical protein
MVSTQVKTQPGQIQISGQFSQIGDSPTTPEVETVRLAEQLNNNPEPRLTVLSAVFGVGHMEHTILSGNFPVVVAAHFMRNTDWLTQACDFTA